MDAHREFGLEKVGFHEELRGPLKSAHGRIKLACTLVALPPANLHIWSFVMNALRIGFTAGRVATQSDSNSAPFEMPETGHDAAT